MENLKEKIGNRKVIAVILLVCTIAFALTYASMRTETGLAVFTRSPPGIPGLFYVTAEAAIYGDTVDLASIKSMMNGTYADDYTYVQWGINPFYRVYSDNTFQEVFSGKLIDVLNQFSGGAEHTDKFSIEGDLKGTYENMTELGAIGASSVLGTIYYFGNVQGSLVAYHNEYLYLHSADYLNLTGLMWYATTGRAQFYNLMVYLNDTICLEVPSGQLKINSSGSLAHFYRWKIQASYSGNYPHSVTFYYKEVSAVQFDPYITIHSEARSYDTTDSPGTGFVSKELFPASPVAGSPFNVTVRADPPAAENMNLTDLYPNTFTWTGSQVVLKKYRAGVGLAATEYTTVTPTSSGSNMTFTVSYDQAPTILQSLQSDEYIHMTYSLTAPEAGGEYTLPPATMHYLIPTP